MGRRSWAVGWARGAVLALVGLAHAESPPAPVDGAPLSEGTVRGRRAPPPMGLGPGEVTGFVRGADGAILLHAQGVVWQVEPGPVRRVEGALPAAAGPQRGPGGEVAGFGVVGCAGDQVGGAGVVPLAGGLLVADGCRPAGLRWLVPGGAVRWDVSAELEARDLPTAATMTEAVQARSPGPTGVRRVIEIGKALPPTEAAPAPVAPSRVWLTSTADGVGVAARRAGGVRWIEYATDRLAPVRRVPVGMPGGALTALRPWVDGAAPMASRVLDISLAASAEVVDVASGEALWIAGRQPVGDTTEVILVRVPR